VPDTPGISRCCRCSRHLLQNFPETDSEGVFLSPVAIHPLQPLLTDSSPVTDRHAGMEKAFDTLVLPPLPSIQNHQLVLQEFETSSMCTGRDISPKRFLQEKSSAVQNQRPQFRPNNSPPKKRDQDTRTAGSQRQTNEKSMNNVSPCLQSLTEILHAKTTLEGSLEAGNCKLAASSRRASVVGGTSLCRSTVKVPAFQFFRSFFVAFRHFRGLHHNFG
jgi:hypothetical protein